MKLTDRTVRTAEPGRYSDGTVKGLMLVVREGGSRAWVLRYQSGGRRRDMGLGPYPEISLAAARSEAFEARRLIKTGHDPITKRGSGKVRTFRETAEALIESKRPGWRNAKHAAQWTATLQTYAYPKLGALDVNANDTNAVLDVLRPIWTIKPETASRVRQRIEAVLDYATATGARTGDNPARWKGHLDHLLAKPSTVRTVKHHTALDWRDAPAFMADLRMREGFSARALEFAILTAARSGEVRGMTWREIDRQDAEWTVPANRIKAGKEQRVPLAAAALALLADPGEPDDLVFPSTSKSGAPLSDMSLTAVLRRMGRGDLTAHGFRSTFRDWVWRDNRPCARGDRGRAGAQAQGQGRSGLCAWRPVVKRRKLMQDWADFLATPAAQTLVLHEVADQQQIAR